MSEKKQTTEQTQHALDDANKHKLKDEQKVKLKNVTFEKKIIKRWKPNKTAVSGKYRKKKIVQTQS